jgi:hypothetical protein
MKMLILKTDFQVLVRGWINGPGNRLAKTTRISKVTRIYFG